MFSGTYHLVTRISNAGESRVTQAQSSNSKKSLRVRANPTFTPWFGDLSILAIGQVCHRNVLVQCIYSFLENSNQNQTASCHPQTHSLIQNGFTQDLMSIN